MTPKTDEPNKAANHLTPLEIASLRYEYVRKLNPTEFSKLFQSNLHGHGAFDDLVDVAMQKDTK